VPLARWYRRLRRHPAAQGIERTLVHHVVVGYAAGRRAWRRSLQLRMVTITLLVSGVLVGAFGTLVASRITDGLVRARVDSGVEQVREAAELAAPQLGGITDPADTSLPSLVSQIGQRLADTSSQDTGVVVAILPSSGRVPSMAPRVFPPVQPLDRIDQAIPIASWRTSSPPPTWTARASGSTSWWAARSRWPSVGSACTTCSR